jgi:hypothetical protein
VTDTSQPTQQQGWAPIPDPTVLTTAALVREITALREVIENAIGANKELFTEKLRSVDQQLTLIEKQRVEQKTDTANAVQAALIAQKEAVREQTAASDRAIAKSEAGTEAQIRQLRDTLSVATTALEAGQGDLKDRISKVLPRETYDTWVVSWLEWRQTVETRLSVAAGAKSGWTSAMGTVVIIVTLLLATVTIIATVVNHH